MSFSTETKNELSRIEERNENCRLAELAGFFRAAGSVGLAGSGRFKIVIATDNPAAARHYKKLVKECFAVDMQLKISRAGALKKGHTYVLTIDSQMKSEDILRETGILFTCEGKKSISDGIPDGIIKEEYRKRAYLRGFFMGAGTISDPDRSYHLEFVCNTENLARDLKELIDTFDDLAAKITRRKDRFAVYMKNSRYISDMLAIMGAHAQVLEFENIKIKKGIVNETVRITNCDNANTDRTLDASQKQIAAIRKIIDRGALAALPDKLRELAELRLENPEASLTQLGEMLTPQLKKSGVNNRMQRITTFADRLP